MTNRILSDEEMAEISQKQHEEAVRDYEEFKTLLADGKCSICYSTLQGFDEDKPCLHWLLMPPGFKKKHFKLIFDKFTYDRIEGYLRWYVNYHQPFRNINDLKEEHDPSKVKALTISHDNHEWSFSFAKNCLEGKDGNHGPHYHFQMRVDGRPLHNYGNRHIKLSDYELWFLDMELGNNPQIKMNPAYAMGMQSAVDDIPTEDLLNAMQTTDDYDSATFHISSMIEADEGTTISGDDIADLIKESRATGVPMHRLIKKLNNVKSTIYVEPGPGVPEAAQRTPRKRGKKK